ncbi:galactose mutarotase-like enzyme [Streptomyces sp. TE33382]
MSRAAKNVRLSVGDAELTVDPVQGCRISSLRIGDTELLRQGERYGSFPMVPWCGRTGDGEFRNGDAVHRLPLNAPPHAIHGTGRDTAWHTAREDGAEAAFYYDLAEPWPYQGRVTQTFELAEDSLTLRLSVETYGDSFPAQAGWHPWFRRDLGGQDVRLSFDAAWQEERGGNHLPTGRRIDPRPRTVGRLLRDARRCRGEAHLAGAARTDGEEPRRVGGDLRRAGRGGVRGAAVGSAERSEHRPAPGHPDRPAGDRDDLELGAALSRTTVVGGSAYPR